MFRRARDPRWLLDPSTPVADRGTFGLSHWDPRSHLVSLRLDASSLAPLADPGDSGAASTATSAALTVLPPDPECAEQDASLHVAQDGTVLLGSFGWYPVPSAAAALTIPGLVTGQPGDARAVAHLTTFIAWGSSVRASHDHGRTFGPHAYLPPVPDTGDPLAARRGAYRGALRGAFAQHDGHLLVSVYDAFRAPGSVHVLASNDGGKTFAHRGTLRDPSGTAAFQEPSLLATPSGSIVAFVRTTGMGDALVTARSTDGGRTWAPHTRHAFRGHPCHPLALRDGRVLLVYGHRHAPYGIRARVVDAEAEHIDQGEELLLRDDGEGPDLGYPWAVQLPDGDVLVVYYWVTADGLRSIAATRVSLT